MDSSQAWSIDYDAVYKQRSERLARIRAEPGLLPGIKEYYKEHPVEFINDWGMTFDPRNIEIGKPAVTPFILFAKQQELINWLVEKWRGRKDGLVEKSRDMGATWLCVAFAIWMWSFYPSSVVGFGSRKEEYVDDLKDAKSIFWKIRQYIALLPKEFRPANWNEKKHATFMSIVNPDNGASIVGEAGNNIGRGNRTSIYFKDESAFYEQAELIEAALSQTSNCKIDVSTPNGNGNQFYIKRHSGKVDVFTLHWRDDPRKSIEWYREQQSKLDAVIIAQEIDIDYNASTNDAYIPGALIEQAQQFGPADVEANGPWIVAIDAAHMGDDSSVIHARRGLLNLEQKVRGKIDGIELAGLVIDWCNELSAGGIDIGAIVIELDGPGVSCYDSMRRSKYADKVQGVHTGARLSNNKDYNVKASIWRACLDYLKAGGCRLPVDPELKSQLASVKYSYKDGVLLMESKKDHKKRLGKSPDKADAFVLTFAAKFNPNSRKPVQALPLATSWR